MPAPSSLGLKLFWNMDTLTSGGKMSDLTGNGFDGTLSGIYTFKTGKVGRCMAFGEDLSGNVALDVGAARPLAGSTNYTLAAWVKPLAPDQGINLVGVGAVPLGSGNGAAFLYYDSVYGAEVSNKFIFVARAGGVANRLVKYATYATGTFHHLAMTYDGSVVVAYIDGTAATSLSASGTYTYESNFGGGQDNWIDEVRLYNRALSASEILDLYLSVDRNDLHDPLADMLRDWKRKWRTVLPRD